MGAKQNSSHQYQTNTQQGHHIRIKEHRTSTQDRTRNAAECVRNARRVTTEYRGMSRNAGDSCGMQSGLWRITKFTITEPVWNGGLEPAEVAIVQGGRGELAWRVGDMLPAPAFRNIPWSTCLLNVCPGNASTQTAHRATMAAECCGMCALAAFQATPYSNHAR